MSAMESVSTYEGAISINDGPELPGRIEVVQELITYRAIYATVPDPTWTHIDTNGHYHAYDDVCELPTLEGRRRHIDCDGGHDDNGDCEGYDVTEWFCRIDGEQIKPRRLPDTDEHQMPGRKSWRGQFTTDQWPDRDMVSVRLNAGGVMAFGVAHAMAARMEMDSEGARVIVELHGAGPLGTRRQR